MKQKTHPDNPFNGKFILPGYEVSENGIDWITKHYHEHNDGLHDWEFEQKNVSGDPTTGGIVYRGVFSIRISDYPLKKCVFLYYSSSEILHIRGVETLGDPAGQSVFYKVGRVNKREFWLYPLKDRANIPRFFTFRMKLKHIG